LFAGIYKMGAGLGPATAFLYSGPAVNVLAIVLTARVLGLQLGIGRAIGAIIFSIILGVCMGFIFRREEKEQVSFTIPESEIEEKRNLLQNALYFSSMVGILVFANWGKPDDTNGVWMEIYNLRWILTSFFAAALGVILIRWFAIAWWKIGLCSIAVVTLSFTFPDQPLFAFSAAAIGLSIITGNDQGESSEWFSSTWDFAKQILPLLLLGVLIAGGLLGRVGHEGLIPSDWVAWAVGGNSLAANFFASFAGAFMYFATLTEVPILQGLIENGMGKGPALALLLAGPALSLPNMLVISKVLGAKKTAVFICLVIVMSTISGIIFGFFFG